uniref:CHK domain-containing protein n=1 Tax=Haemonchus contortus TaxID=6289 RepID=A0A7I4Y8S1_HAECO
MFEPAEGLFGTFITEEWIVNEFARSYGVQISHLKFQRIGETEGSFSRVCLMECESNGRLPRKLIVKIPTCLTYVENRRRRGWTHGDYSHIRDLLITYHNTETLFYQHAGGVVGVPQIFLSQRPYPTCSRGYLCDEMKSILALYANIQKGCANVPDDVRSRLNTNVFELLSPTTLSLETLTQRLNRMSLWRPELKSTFQKLVQLLPKILDHHLISRLHFECPHQHLLVHGDLYSSNILWQNGTVKAIIDYQMVHYGNPVEDLVRLFTTGLTASERKGHTIGLLEYYRIQLTSLITGLEQTFTSDWLFSCYKIIFPMAGLWAIVSLHASFESSTSQEPSDSSKLDRITKKIYGIAVEITETVNCTNVHQ